MNIWEAKPITGFVSTIAALPNTFWGIIILLLSMYISVHYSSNIGYYFAGIGSTLVGIQKETDQLKGKSDASDQTNKS